MPDTRDAQIAIELVGIKSALDRVLGHQIDHKQKFEKLDVKVNSICESIHNVDLKIIQGDNDVRNECKNEVFGIYRNVLAVCVAMIGALFTGMWAWVQNKFNG